MKSRWRLQSARFCGLLLWAALLSRAVSPAGAQGTYTLSIVAQGVSSSKGVVGVLVFRSSAGWPESTAAAFRRQAVPAHAGSVVVAVKGLPAGSYAVVVLHDENENMQLDRNWLGIPTEQWGMSRNPTVGWSAPSFQQAVFRLAGDTQIHVTLHYGRGNR